MGLGMEGSTGIGALGGEITGLGVGLGRAGRTGIGALGGEITGLGVGLGTEGTTGIGTIGGEVTGPGMGIGAGIVGVEPGLVGGLPVPVAPLSRIPPGSPEPETAPEIIAGGVIGPGIGLGAGGVGVGPGFVGGVSVSPPSPPSLTGDPPSCLAMETAPEITAGGVSSVSD